MAYIVTARKYRPQKFDEVVGQQHITQTLKNAILNNRIAHAYIFAGPRGVGKTTTARILAKSLNCTSPKSGEPCGNCEMCNAFDQSVSLDIIEIDGASNRRIEEIRQLRESVKYAPTKGSYKIYIIDEVHMLTTESFNALLKTLEEPPEHTIFIFATTDIHKVPLTIISRCQRFDFRRIEMQEIKTLLKNIANSEQIEIDDQALTLIAKKADGALRDAQSLFDQVVSFCGNNIEVSEIAKMLNIISEEVYFDISDAILTKDFGIAFQVTRKIYDNGWNFIDFVNGLVEHFRNIAAIVISGKSELVETAEIYKGRYLGYTSKFPQGDCIRILQFLSNLQNSLRLAADQKLKVEIALFHLIGLEKSSTISDLLHELHSTGPKYSVPGPTTQKVKENNSLFASQHDETSAPPRTTTSSPTVEINNFTPPSVSTSADFNSIVNKWGEFVDEVCKEKMFGNNLLNSQPFDFDGSKLSVSLQNPDDVEIVNQNLDHLSKKSKSFFGHKVEFAFDGESRVLAAQPARRAEPKADSPLISAIKNELGGKEI